MKINIMATGLELTQSISDYVHKKIASLDKYLNAELDVVAHVEVGKTTKHHKTGEVFKAEIHLVAPGLDLYVVTHEEDLYAAIDKVKDDMSRELRRTKGRQSALTRKGEQLMKGAMKGYSWSIDKLKGFKKKK
jgi:putative sigma-54 modulation protein